MFEKKKPLRCKENLEIMRQRKCEACGRPPPSDACHITTKRLRGDEMNNLMSLCRGDHQLQHLIGLKTFVEKFNLKVTWEDGYPRRSDG